MLNIAQLLAAVQRDATQRGYAMNGYAVQTPIGTFEIIDGRERDTLVDFDTISPKQLTDIGHDKALRWLYDRLPETMRVWGQEGWLCAYELVQDQPNVGVVTTPTGIGFKITLK